MPSSLHRRIFLVYSLLFILVIAIAFIMIGVYVSGNISAGAEAGLDAYSENVGRQIGEKFRQMDRIGTRILFSQSIMDIISESIAGYGGGRNYFDQNRDKLNVVFQNLLVILGLDISNTVVNIYSDKAFITTAQSSTDWGTIRNDAERGVMAGVKRRLALNPNSPLLTGPHRSYWVTGSGAASEYFSLSRRLYDPPTGRDMGILQVLKKRSEIESICVSSDETIRVFLFDGEKSIINYPAAQDPFTSDAEFILGAYQNGFKNGFHRGAAGRGYLASLKRIEGIDYGILVMQKYSSGFFMVYLGIMLIAVLFLMIVAVSLNLLVSRYLTRPLEEIIGAMRKVTRDNLEMNVDFHSSTGDIRQLQQFYNEMIARVREAMNQTLQSKLNEREAYYLALQFQISPHFMYNCISTINAIAYENGVPQIADICELLSNMLRYVMKFDRDNSTIRGELEYTCNYLNLMKIRYSDEFVFSVHMDEICGAFPIPRLMLQTVVENCFRHAFVNAPFPWQVSINIFAEGKKWTAEVIDNGAGIDASRVEEIIAQSESLFEDALRGIGELHPGGLGLLNSLTRLRLLYNNNIHFSAKSLYRGAIVR
ncbi:MAG: histidine kinase, partial [Treponema sp.]|nr:histidine kinase [Treponema sp.]